MTRRKFTTKYKTKVVLDALKEQETIAELGQKYQLAPQQINSWKREFLANAEQIFATPNKSKKSEQEEREDNLLTIIGSLKVENDFLKKALS